MRPAASPGLDSVRHLYVHLPFCAHRCGYCDFVTVVGRAASTVATSTPCWQSSSSRARARLGPRHACTSAEAPRLSPARRAGAAARRRCRPPTRSTVEANPETVTPELARLLRRAGVNRVSLGRRASSRPARGARAAGGARRPSTSLLPSARCRFDNISLDLLYGIPGQSPSDLAAISSRRSRSRPSTSRATSSRQSREPASPTRTELSSPARPRRWRATSSSSSRPSSAAGYRWYETANFCRDGVAARHNLAYWLGQDYLGLGIGAVSTVGGVRWRNRPSLAGYSGRSRRPEAAAREIEPLGATSGAASV